MALGIVKVCMNAVMRKNIFLLITAVEWTASGVKKVESGMEI